MVLYQLLGVFIMDYSTIIQITAYLMIYIACDLKRTGESKIPFLSLWWFAKIILVTGAGLLFTNYA